MEENTAKPLKPWKISRGPIKADPFALEAAKAINGLLAEPIGVLPCAEGDMVRPFKIRIGLEIEALLKLDAALPELRKALRRYTRSAGYLLAMAQPDANRHGINGEAVEPVSEGDRLNARQSFAAIQEHRKRLRLKREAAQALENSSLTVFEPGEGQSSASTPIQ